MSVPLPRSRALWLVLALVCRRRSAPARAERGGARAAASLYTQTNDPAGNAVQRFDRAADGSLTPAGTFATGGAGLATLGGRQGAVELSGDGRNLYAVNAGSDSVSAFRVGRRRTRPARHRARRAASRPTASTRTAAASTSSTPAARRTWPRSGAGFDGSLKAIPGGTRDARSRRRRRRAGLGHARRALAGGHRAASRTGSRRCRSIASAAPARRSSRRRAARCRSASRITRRGDDRRLRGRRQHRLLLPRRRGGALRTVTASLPVGHGAACWVAVSPDGRLAYTGNASRQHQRLRDRAVTGR